MKLKRTPESKLKSPNVYNDTSRSVLYGIGSHFTYLNLSKIREYEDLNPSECKKSF
jgi:hypothetical protein